MKNFLSFFILSSVVLTPLAFAGEVQYKGPAAQPMFLFCQAHESAKELPDETKTNAKLFLSGIFQMMDQANLTPVNKQFLNLIRQKYGFKGDYGVIEEQLVSCTATKSKEQTEHAKSLPVNAAKQNGVEVIETGWTFAG